MFHFADNLNFLPLDTFAHSRCQGFEKFETKPFKRLINEILPTSNPNDISPFLGYKSGFLGGKKTNGLTLTFPLAISEILNLH